MIISMHNYLLHNCLRIQILRADDACGSICLIKFTCKRFFVDSRGKASSTLQLFKYGKSSYYTRLARGFGFIGTRKMPHKRV